MKLQLSTNLMSKGATLLCAATLMLAFATNNGPAQDEETPDKNLSPQQTPHTAKSATGGNTNLAEAATNPIANLVQVQIQNTYNWENHNSSGYGNVATIQPVIPFKLPWVSLPLLITRTTLPYVWTPDLGDSIGRKIEWAI